MIIRKAQMKDVKKLNWLLTLLIRDEKRYDQEIDENFEVKNMYENYIDDLNKCLLVAEENDVIVGYLYGILKDKIALLDALYVETDHRKKGVANSLIDAFQKWCINNKVNYIDVNVWTNNINANKLYEKKGFRTIKETKRMKLK